MAVSQSGDQPTACMRPPGPESTGWGKHCSHAGKTASPPPSQGLLGPEVNGLRGVHTVVTMHSGDCVLDAFLLGEPTGEANTPEGLNTARGRPAGSLPDSRDQISGDNHRLLCPLPYSTPLPTRSSQAASGSRAVGCWDSSSGGAPER